MASLKNGRLICICDNCHGLFNATDYPWCRDYADNKDKHGHRITIGWHVPRRCPRCKKEILVTASGEKTRGVREATEEEIGIYDALQREIIERVYEDLHAGLEDDIDGEDDEDSNNSRSPRHYDYDIAEILTHYSLIIPKQNGF